MELDSDKKKQDSNKWEKEIELLRSILISCGLEETIKWDQYCYTLKGKNIAIIGGFKSFFALSFFKGALINDELNLLTKPGDNTQSARIIKFTDKEQINELHDQIKTYIFDAITIEQRGLKVEHKQDISEIIPEEFIQLSQKFPHFEKAFHALTPGRQRGYLMFFSQAKQSETRTARIEKYMDRILAGKGINDCTCGLSKKMPSCDGSHKFAKNL